MSPIIFLKIPTIYDRWFAISLLVVYIIFKKKKTGTKVKYMWNNTFIFQVLVNHQINLLKYGTMYLPPLKFETDLTSQPTLIWQPLLSNCSLTYSYMSHVIHDHFYILGGKVVVPYWRRTPNFLWWWAIVGD